MSTTVKVSAIVLSVLEGRKGFDGWWGSIDEETQQEILDDIDFLVNTVRPEVTDAVNFILSPHFRNFYNVQGY